MGFEPTPPKRLVPKTSALDHSANQSVDTTRDLGSVTYPLCSGGLAQLVECDVRNVEAAGSKPAFSSFVAVLFFVLERKKRRGWGGIEPPTSRTLNENHTTRLLALMIADR